MDGVDGRAVEDAAQLLRDVLRRGRALVRRLREQAQDQRLERLRALGVVPRRRDGRRVDVLADDADRVVAEEGRAAGDHLVEHRAERVEIAARVGRAAERLLGRHVGDGADHHALHRHARAVDGDGEAEVAERGVAVGVEPDVAGLEVAVDDAAAVRVLRAPGRPARRSSSRGRAAMRCWSAFASRSSTEPPAMQLRDDERRAALVAGVEDGDDVRVVAEAAHRLRLAPHADDAVGVEAVGLDQREGDVAVELGVVGEVDALLARPRRGSARTM